MINHKRPKQSLWSYEDNLQSFKIEAFGSCKANSELFDSYGKKCNSRFLLNYGFIEEDNDANEYEFIINFESSLPLYQQKISLIPQLENYRISFKISRDFERQRFFEFISFIRFLVIDTLEDLKSIIVSLKK